jgi:hypothetical protein
MLPAPANHRDDGLLAATLDAIGVIGPLPQRPTVHLDAGYDYQPCRQVLAARSLVGQIATRGLPAPIQADRRWVIERTHAWGNQYGKLRWCTERRRLVVEFWLAVASAIIVLGRLVRRAWTHTAGRVALAATHDRPTGAASKPKNTGRTHIDAPPAATRLGRWGIPPVQLSPDGGCQGAERRPRPDWTGTSFHLELCDQVQPVHAGGLRPVRGRTPVGVVRPPQTLG